MKKVIAFIKLLVLTGLAALVIFFTAKSLAPMQKSASGNSEFAEAYDGAGSINKIDYKHDTENIKAIYDVDNGAGYIFDATAANGYGGPIDFLVGISKDGLIEGLKILNHTETEGFGAAIAESNFLEGIKDVNISKGISAGSKDAENGQFDGISGATVTTNAFLDELKEIKNVLSQLSDKVEPTSDEKSFFAEKYKDLLGENLEEYTFRELKLEETDPQVFNKNFKRMIWVGKGEDFDSYILQVSGQGFAGPIEYLLRVTKDFVVYNIVFAEQAETADYGGYIEDPVYKDVFKGLNLEKNFITKAIKLRENPKGEKDILLISGATITSKTMQESLDAVIEGLVNFKKLSDAENKFVTFDLNDVLTEVEETGPKHDHVKYFENIDESKALDKGTNDEVIGVSMAFSAGKEVGKIFDIKTEGFAGAMEYALLVSDKGKVLDFVVYDHSETEGYGADIETDDFKKKIIGLDLANTKEFVSGEDFDGISGATFTNDGIIQGLNSAVKAYSDSKDSKLVEEKGE